MSTTARQNQILELLNENGFMTVELLSRMTYSSPSSIRRDLTKLQNMYFIKRTHGGAKPLTATNQAAPFSNRMSLNATEKRKIANKAASLLCDGQIIMLDSSSTASFLVPYISKYKDVTLFTNNMTTAMSAINYGIPTHCIGGKALKNSTVLTGPQSYKIITEIHPDILFFSSHSVDDEGIIYDPTEEENYLRHLMLSNARQSVFLCDSEKFGRKSSYTLTSLDNIDFAVFDTEYKGLKTKCKIL